MQKSKARTEQQKNGELGLIIDEFGRAMWNADREYIAQQPSCAHDPAMHFTASMQVAWAKYVEFCMENPS